MYFSWRFRDVIQEIEYALKEGVNISLGNLALIFQGLSKLRYKNLDL